MSLTLRDAQHLCWKNFRKIYDNLNPEQGKRWNEFVMIADLVENAGLVASAVKKLGGFENTGELGTKEILAVRLSDMLYAAFVLAEHYGIELEDSFLQTVNDRILNLIK
jgi:NTP pyrophosphatase (non-canonical NTP hydrolase)